MEIKESEYVKQIYQNEIENIIETLIRIETRLTGLNLDKFSMSLKAVVVALSIEELDKNEKALFGILDPKTKELAKSLMGD